MSRRLLAPFAFLALAACGANVPEGEQIVGQAVDSLEVTENESGLLVASAEAATVMTGDTPETLAERASERWPTLFTPSSCATADLDQTHVTYLLDHCIGKRHVVPVSGQVDVVFTLSGNSEFREDATAQDLSIGGATLSFQTGAELHEENATRSLAVHTNGQGRGPAGTDLSRDGDYTIGWDDLCISIDGAWQTTVADEVWSTSVTGFRACADQCPDAGGRIDYEGGISGVTLTVEFDGSGRASWTDSKGKSGQVSLGCGG